MSLNKWRLSMASTFTPKGAISLGIVSCLFLAGCSSNAPSEHDLGAKLYPAPGGAGLAPDISFSLSFDTAPTIGSSGFIRVHDIETGQLVDEIDMSIASSPLPTGRYPPNSTQEDRVALGRSSVMSNYQVNTIGGIDFHFHPVLVRGNTATIKLHNNRLEYDRDYEITVDAGVLNLADHSFDGIDANKDWQFSTRETAPAADVSRIVVSKDGSGDFVSVQGAIDFAPATSPDTLEIFISDGDYEEIVMLNDKANIVIRGESREGVVVHYANNSGFNPPRKAPSRRPAFSIVNGDDIQLSNFTIKNDLIGQAEALLAKGDRIIVDSMTLNGSGDALTTGGSMYMVDSELTGDGDTILAYATLFCERCTIKSVGPFVWPRTPEGQHGNIFIDSHFTYVDEPLPWTVTDKNPEGVKTRGILARLPRNGPANTPYANFPHAEMVLIDSTLEGVPAVGWDSIEDADTFNWDTVRIMEHNSVDTDGASISLADRHAIVRKLDADADQALIANYRDPSFVFDGWTPEVKN